MSETQELFRLEIEGHIANVTMCNPKKRNAMVYTFDTQLTEVFKKLELDEDVRVVVLRADGQSFCAGLDIMGWAMSAPFLMNIPNPASVKPKVLRLIRDFQASLTQVEKCSKPVIAAIQGHCIGGGLDLAAACDIRLASKDALFSIREARVGIMCDLGSLQRLPGIIGEGHTRQLAYTGEDFGGEKALKINLINELYDDVDSLWKAAADLAQEISENAPLAVQASKEVMNWGRGRPIDETLEYVAVRNHAIFPSEDLMESVAAFTERRKPNFKGK